MSARQLRWHSLRPGAEISCCGRSDLKARWRCVQPGSFSLTASGRPIRDGSGFDIRPFHYGEKTGRSLFPPCHRVCYDKDVTTKPEKRQGFLRFHCRDCLPVQERPPVLRNPCRPRRTLLRRLDWPMTISSG